MQKVLDWKEYEQTARQAAAEGNVLVRNENRVLPLKKGCHISVFGRMQFHYYKSGTGSGGMVNVDKVIGILDALKESEDVIVNDDLIRVYEDWEKAHPYDEGVGWGNEPWSQVEMPLSNETVRQASTVSDTAVVILARTAGEDRDNLNKPGSYELTEIEEDMLHKVRKYFHKMVVVLNVGSVIDMSFVDLVSPDAVLYAWQGGMIGGLGTVDVLTGKENPSGKLTDTIAYHIEDYPSNSYFGGEDEDIYAEDIYVGYRYFETVAKENVRYPFGFGLSYTQFGMETSSFSVEENGVKIEVEVTNRGKYAGKEVVQVYVNPPQGKLGKPLRNLAGFQKTKKLTPGETEIISVFIPFPVFASYDESGVTGNLSSYVLEEGNYVFYVGNNVRDVKEAGNFEIEATCVVEKLSQALAPTKSFERMKAVCSEEGKMEIILEEAPLRKISPRRKRVDNLPEEIPFTGNKGYVLADVKRGKISERELVAQFTDEELSCIIRGEGMGSPKVTAGTAAAFGGVSDSLKAYGLPCGCCSDGPSGMRLDSGMKAFSLPNGTLIGCTFNTELVERLYGYTGIEMRANKVDVLLGPGMNIHRHPLNGRNFEYFSEDPFLTGKMAAAQLRGLHNAGVTGAAKHFCANNQETSRHFLNSIVSERALREIYLKGFEIAVKEGNADAVMTTYGAVNGIWTAGNYDLCTQILRKEWGFDGFVMTDWWAKISDEGEEVSKTNFAAMVRAQNDVYMVCSQADKNSSGDNTLEALLDGRLSRAELQQSAGNIVRFLMHTPAYERMNEQEVKIIIENGPMADEQDVQDVIYYELSDSLTLNLEGVEAKKGSCYTFAINCNRVGGYKIEITGKSDLGELAQIPVTLFTQSIPIAVFTWNGTNGEWVTKDKNIVFLTKYSVLRLYFGQNGVQLKDLKLTFIEDLENIRDISE